MQGAKPAELTLCKYYDELGRCPLVDCNFAHGLKDLAQRERDIECAITNAAVLKSALELIHLCNPPDAVQQVGPPRLPDWTCCCGAVQMSNHSAACLRNIA